MGLLDYLKKIGGGVDKIVVDGTTVYQTPSGTKNITSNGKFNVKEFEYVEVDTTSYWDGVNKIINGAETYTISGVAPIDGSVKEYEIIVPYNGYRYIALIGMYNGSAWISVNDYWYWPTWAQYNGNTLLASGCASETSNLRNYVYDSKKGDVCKFKIKVYRPDAQGMTQTIPLRITRFNM